MLNKVQKKYFIDKLLKKTVLLLEIHLFGKNHNITPTKKRFNC